MTILYRIRDWRVHYENNRSREILHPQWCAIPNKQDGLGYRRLLRRACGEAAYGCFVATVLAASKHKVRNGWLTDDGTDKGIPWDAEAVGIKTGFSTDTAAKMLEYCSDTAIGWIECLPACMPANSPACGNPAPACGNPAGTCVEEKGREWNEGNTHTQPAREGLLGMADTIRSARPEYATMREMDIAAALNTCPADKRDKLATAVAEWAANQANAMKPMDSPLASVRKMVARVVEGVQAGPAGRRTGYADAKADERRRLREATRLPKGDGNAPRQDRREATYPARDCSASGSGVD